MRFSAALAASTMLATLTAATAAQAEEAAPADAGSSTFSLGQIIVTAPATEDLTIGGSTLSSEAIYTFNRATLDDAVNLIPGVVSSNSGGTRNERLIYVRGFDRFQVPLSIDGIRVYLPADNRLDFGRFLTADVAEIQVAKGYVSVLDGPGGMGGAINIVTRKPTKELEVEVGGQLNMDSRPSYAGYNAFGLIGTKHDKWYAQVSYTRSFTDHWRLSDDFTPTVPTLEDGGDRDFSQTEDWRLNAKIGFTPNATDEYVLTYTRQEGAKNAPLHVSDTVSTSRFWSWPYWNLDSFTFLSTTALGDRATLKTRAFYNNFDNLLRSFNDRTQTTQTRGYTFNSPYEDEAYGGSAQLDVKLTPADTIRLAAHYRRDKHVEFQTSFNTAGVGTTEPPQEQTEDTWSIALENELQLSPALTFTAGFSYDWRDLKSAEEYGSPLGTSGQPSVIYNYPLVNSDAWNAQGRLDWQVNDATKLYASVSSRARFPTIAERFSQRFGQSIPNPALKPERATNYEIGGNWSNDTLRLEGAAFYSRVTDAIFNIPVLGYSCTASTTPPADNGCAAQTLNFTSNVGNGDYYGVEASASVNVSPTLELGANYSWIKRDLTDPNPNNPNFRPTGVPVHKGFIYANWRPIEQLSIVPSVDLATDRWTARTAQPTGTTAVYYKTGSYANVALRIDYAIIENVQIGVGARNLLDQNYSLSDGFPEPGRTFFASIRAKY